MQAGRGAALAVWLAAGAALAQAPDAGTEAPPPDAGVAAEKFIIQTLEANKVAVEQAPGLTQLLAARFVEAKLDVLSQADLQRAVGVERQRQLMGCTGESCATELADALGARYVVAGRVDRFNDKFLVNATLWDQQRAEVKVKAQREVNDAGLLPQAVQELADELLAPFGVPPKVGVKLVDRVQPLGFNLGLKLGTTLITSLVRLAPVGELELGFRASLAWTVFLQIGFGITFDKTTQTAVGLTPGMLGLRYNFRADKGLQPTLGGGLGVLTTINAITGSARLSLVLAGGLQYLITQRVVTTLEASIDLLGLAYGVAENSASPLNGVNLGLSLGIAYRF